ncbi:TVP38/TMEM64 family protein [Collinsella intestinalis]|uniref:TVP38/TMEM64 family protein n=1 Tax=Collinsella intestinalis TaxID=147207 RepID=UPI00216B2C5D|nr:VTT domain-containing protein [Collinsella intestinalis]
MMRMQTEGETPMEMNALLPQQPVACGGAARKLDVKKLAEAWKRDRAEAAPDAVEEARSTAAAKTCEPLDEDMGIKLRRKALRRRVLIGLVAAAAATALLCWEYLPGLLAWLADARAVRAFVADHAFASRLTMLGINIVQVLLAFLPGEPVELASGYAFGFWEGTALCLVASGLATSAIYWATRRWGWKLVGLFFDRSLFDRFSWLKSAKRLELIMLIVFLIPGTPKDFLTYFAGLTNMRFLPVVLIATFGRIPSIVTSTITASAVGSGNWPLVACTLVASALLLAVGGLMYRRLRSRTR